MVQKLMGEQEFEHPKAKVNALIPEAQGCKTLVLCDAV